MVVRWALLACAVVFLASCGAGTVGDSPTATAIHLKGGTALSQLETLTVKGRAPRTGYERDKFGDGWGDTNHNGCDPTHLPKTTRGIVRGGEVEIDIDHVVALSDAWQKGAFGWDTTKRVAFANDPLNLLAVDASANRQKGDGDAATWLPANNGSRCDYVARQVGVKAKYGLWITSAEHDAIDRVLRTCPSEPAAVDASPTTSSPATDPRFGTCGEAEDAGYGPYVRGKDPEYAWYRDSNDDGTVC
jgi:uncharacterized protein DUF1524/excalibur calcium-binding domain-containing protein